MKGIKHFITRVIAQFNNKKSTAMDERKTDFMKATAGLSTRTKRRVLFRKERKPFSEKNRSVCFPLRP